MAVIGPPLTASKQAKARGLHCGDKNGTCSSQTRRSLPLEPQRGPGLPSVSCRSFLLRAELHYCLQGQQRSNSVTVRNDNADSPAEHGGAAPRTELAASRLWAEDPSALIRAAAASASRAARPGAAPSNAQARGLRCCRGEHGCARAPPAGRGLALGGQHRADRRARGHIALDAGFVLAHPC